MDIRELSYTIKFLWRRDSVFLFEFYVAQATEIFKQISKRSTNPIANLGIKSQEFKVDTIN